MKFVSNNCYYEKIGNTTKNITEDIPFEIPDNWSWVRLGTVFSIGSSKRVHKSDWQSSGIPFYRARDIEPLNEGVFKSGLFISDKFYNEIKTKYGIPQINDILITAVGTLGKTFIVSNNDPFYYKDGNIICLSNSFNIVPQYIKILFESDFIDKQIHDTSKGTTVDTYTIIHANKTLIPLPSINEQQRIVALYEKIINKINSINVDLQDIKTICETTKLKILDDIFGENTSYKSYYGERKNATLESIISKNKIGDGDWVLSEDMDEKGEYSLVQLKHIGNGKYLSHKPYNHINSKFFIDNNCSEIKENYLLINRLVADKMDVCILPKLDFKTITSVDVCWIAPDESYSQKYLMYYLLSPTFQNEVMLKASGSTRKRISKKNLVKIPMAIHDEKNQEMIAKDIEKMFAILNSIVS